VVERLAGKLNAGVFQKGTLMRMVLSLIRESSQKRTLRAMLKDPRATRGFRSTGQLEKAIGADRSTTERLLLAVGARKSDVAEEWTLNPL
jgi:ribosomal protein L13E